MNTRKKQSVFFILTAILVLFVSQVSVAQTDSDTTQLQFGGPASVTGQQAEDAKPKATLFDLEILPSYFKWKESFQKKTGFSYTLDYTAGLFSASNTLNEYDFFSTIFHLALFLGFICRIDHTYPGNKPVHGIVYK